MMPGSIHGDVDHQGTSGSGNNHDFCECILCCELSIDEFPDEEYILQICCEYVLGLQRQTYHCARDGIERDAMAHIVYKNYLLTTISRKQGFRRQLTIEREKC
jgi:hypothetical protein